MMNIIKLCFISIFALSVAACGGGGGGGGSLDTVGPVVTVPSNIQLSTLDSNEPATNTEIAAFLAGATAVDDVDGSVAVENNAPASFPIGMTTVTFSAVDAAGNTTTATAEVNIVQNKSFTLNVSAIELTRLGEDVTVDTSSLVSGEKIYTP